MRHRWLLFVPVILIAGCATSPSQEGGESHVSQKFNIQAVFRACARLGCEEPNTVVARYFANTVRKTRSACIVHVIPKNGQPPLAYWDDYLQPMHRFLAGSRLHLYAYAPSGRSRSTSKRKARQNLKQLEALYVRHGVVRGAISKKVISQGSAVTPPYREPYCQNRPLLEIFEGVRLVSPVASWAAEDVIGSDRASRTVLVVVETRNGKRPLSLRIKSLVERVIVTMGSKPNADNRFEVSPALESYPIELLESLRTCTARERLFGSDSRAVDNLEAWFKEFQSPVYARILSGVRRSAGERSVGTVDYVRSGVDEVRQLVDYRTEQALISMTDAAVRRYGNSPGCRDTAARLLLPLAAQRDRAWAWAEVVDRFLERSEDRRETELRSRRVAESLRRVERFYDRFEWY